uniref:MCF.2 cell line derived transforming sequence-like 2 n=1 Tax=Pseudonaja textilis TaxID=8673 RepID=A0A670ZQY3_PSETE
MICSAQLQRQERHRAMKVNTPLLCRQDFACQGDEIMQQEIRPVTAVEIIEQLHRQFAILSGGRGKDGAPIITFPEYPGFSEIPDEDFLNVVTYLTMSKLCWGCCKDHLFQCCCNFQWSPNKWL